MPSLSVSFANQVAVVTGASSGIGCSLARLLAAEGCRVGLVARRRESLAALAAEITAGGGTAAVAPADVGDRAQVLAAVQEVAARLGPIDLLIANAGLGILTRVDPVNSADVETMFRINFLGVVYAIEAVLPGMLQRGRGRVAAVSSLAAYRGMPGKSAYCASKAALNIYLEGLRVQLRHRGVAVTTVCPGFIRTPMTADNRHAMPFLLEADEAARRIIEAIRRGRKVYNFPWQAALLVKLVRWLPDWVIARAVGRLE